MKVYGLVGRSLAHSFSQRYFTEKFEREGLRDHKYRLFELSTIDGFPPLLRDTEGLCGLNVTVPYKEAVIPFLDKLDPLAAAVGAVNTIAIRDGRTIGHNTDVQGFRETLEPLLPSLRKPGSDIRLRALILGSGGASRAVGYVLRELGIRFRVVSRSRERGDITWDLVDRTSVGVCRLIINTTPLGMYPDVEDCPPLPFAVIGPEHLVIDLIYNPEETLLLRRAKESGARTLNGLRMLEAQAEASWRVWRSAADSQI